MTRDSSENNQALEAAQDEIVRQLRQEILTGKHWYLAVLEAIGRWNAPSETLDGRCYRYLISGEAFDWLCLAERLCGPVGDLLPEPEKTALLFYGEPPVEIAPDTFRELIGEIKYHQYLNYFYGVTVEEAVQLAVEEEVRKERWAAGFHHDRENTNEAFRRVYGTSKTALLRRFRKEKGYPQVKSISLTELREFTYWLFKLRVKHSDKAKVASDTKKGLDWIQERVFSRWLKRRAFGL